MRRAATHAPAGSWPKAEKLAAITLDWGDRHRRRILLTDDAGAEFLLDLPEALHLADGDGLQLDAGGWVEVRAADEAVMDVTATDAAALARLAWHIGNRHKPVQILSAGALRLPQDHVLEEMVRGLGGAVEMKHAPFQPEPGAYATTKGGPALQGHDHVHDRDHGHHHDHDHSHDGHDHHGHSHQEHRHRHG
ncbi:MAG TPA: urease accessory protein UreE [Terriglobales bacterium]|nr:urease accessory protein UreE [Terriglobales bacterium]